MNTQISKAMCEVRMALTRMLEINTQESLKIADELQVLHDKMQSL